MQSFVKFYVCVMQTRKRLSDDPFAALFKQAASNRKTEKNISRSNKQRNNNRNHSALPAKNKTNKQVLCNQARDYGSFFIDFTGVRSVTSVPNTYDITSKII